jgi:ABC-type nitrate/sulfonate/bicarbonate transport system permease component
MRNPIRPVGREGCFDGEKIMVTKTAARTQSYGKALALLATLFFMWGFISVINNTLLPHLRSVFDLNYTQTTLIGVHHASSTIRSSRTCAACSTSIIRKPP